METVEFNGWENNVRLSNNEIEIIITKDIGPRIIRCGFIGEKNVFKEFEGQQGTSGETEWIPRGGHRLWIAPEEKPLTYELDNSPIEIEEIPNGVKTIQPKGDLSGFSRTMEITLDPNANKVKILHKITNEGDKPVEAASWALSMMNVNGMAIIPMPKFIAHTDRLTHNQEWSLWGYTNFSDPRWTLGSRYIFFRQDPTRGPNKLGIAHREGWVAYSLDNYLFVKKFEMPEGKKFADGGVNFETFSNEDMLELETLSELTEVAPGESIAHEETWELHKNIAPCKTEDDVDANVLPLV